MSSSGLLKKFTKVFPVPKSLSFDFVGIDICKNTVRVMQLHETKNGKVPKKYKEYKLIQKCGLMESDPSIKDCGELINTLKEIKKEFGVEYVNVSIPELMTYMYKVEVPSEVGSDLGKSLAFSIEENVPIKPEDALLDYYVVGVNDKKIEVIVTVVDKNMVEKFTELFEMVDLKPVSFEPETHAIARGVIDKGNKGQYILLNLDSCLSSVAVIEDEIVQYTQTLPISNVYLSKEFDLEEAKILKEQINKVIIYWSTSIAHAEKEEMKNMYLVGGHAASPEILNYLEKNLSVNVKFANVWKNCFDLDDYIPDLNLKDSLRYATAVGLSLKKIK